MPWRDDTRPYYVFVSELMLQQTQVARVIPKFEAFIERFPDESALANATLADVLKLWQGLGYNRRAKFLHDSAKMIVSDFNGIFPDSSADILSLNGVGKNTLGAIEAYAFNRPSIFVETNVRSVYIHHFFENTDLVDDEQIIEKLEQTIERVHPREFYWALMDYGSWLKSNGIKNNARSTHYKKQSPLEGSVRQIRGRIIATLSEGDMSQDELARSLNADERFSPALNSLFKDGLIQELDTVIHLTK